MLSAIRRSLQTMLGLTFFAVGLYVGGFGETVLWFMAAATILGAAA